MSRYNSETYRKDLQKTIESANDILKALEGKKVLLTGATGLIGAAIADLLIWYNKDRNVPVELYAAGRNEKQIEEKFKPYEKAAWFHIVQYEATGKIKFECPVNYIIHGAGIAYPKMFTQSPVETMRVALYGTDQILKYGVEQKIQRMVFISSSEVYGKHAGENPLEESEYGYIDLLNPRSSYSMGKRAAETMCISYAKEYDLHVTVARPGHIYGPTARREDNRVSSMFAYDAADGKNLIMKSNGTQIRSYCYALDCASAILFLLLKGEKELAYNISNRNSIMSVKELAEQLAKEAGVKVQLQIPKEEERQAFNPMDNSSLNGEKLELLGWQGLFGGEEGTAHTVRIIREGRL